MSLKNVYRRLLRIVIGGAGSNHKSVAVFVFFLSLEEEDLFRIDAGALMALLDNIILHRRLNRMLTASGETDTPLDL